MSEPTTYTLGDTRITMGTVDVCGLPVVCETLSDKHCTREKVYVEGLALRALPIHVRKVLRCEWSSPEEALKAIEPLMIHLK